MRVIGLMSGTSADGIDAALCEIEGAPPRLTARILETRALPYASGMRTRILAACQPETSRVDELCLLNFDLARLFADACHGWQADVIGSHGQTVWHYAQSDGSIAATLQIVDGSVIAELTGITTISNFRARDVAAGGQGAPLIGYVDWLLLRHPTEWRAIQNIGGMANVTFLPPLADESSAPLVFDTGVGNALIDAAAGELTGGRLTYDADGALASTGQIDEAWLTDLLDHPYYRRQPPKTTGRELFGSAYARALVATGRERGLSVESIMATITALTAWSIADAYRRFAPAPISEMILGGGGKHNRTLINLLRTALPEIAIRTHEDYGIDGDQKEALAFAVLAYETWHNRPGSLPVLTGARHPVVLGEIAPGANYADLVRRTWR